MGGHDPIFQKLCSLSFPLFGTNCGGDGQETIFTTKIQNKSAKVLCPHLRLYLYKTQDKLLPEKLKNRLKTSVLRRFLEGTVKIDIS